MPTAEEANECVGNILYWAKEARTATKNRDRSIRKAHKAGFSLREIAEIAGVSHQTVSNILNR